MAKKFLVPIDLNKNELQNAVFQNLGSAPSSPANGQIYYLTTGGHDVQTRINGAWISLVPTSLLGMANTWTSTNVFNGAVTGNNTINLTGTGASSVGGTMSATVHISTGITGATAASRYVGATASGAPGSGTFSTGDYIIDQTGTMWVCTAGGSPGTWKKTGDYLLAATNTWSASNTFTGGAVFNSAITGNNTIALSGAGASSVGGTFTGTALIASGLTGATSASRYVGATATGSPGSGTFSTGDFVVAQNGHIFICTAGGSPGTWADVAGSGLTPASSVVSDTTFGASSVVGSSLNYARQDHSHGSPTHVDADHSGIHLNALGTATGDYSMGSHRLTNVLDPLSAQDVATKNYVDTNIAGLLWKNPVRAATTAALAANTYANGASGVGATLTANSNGIMAAVDGQTLGGATNQTITAMTNAGTTVTATVASNANLAVGQIVTVSGSTGFATNNPNGTWTIASLVGTTQFTFVVNSAPTGSYTASSATEVTLADRVLVQNESTGANNGIYIVTQVGTAALPYILTRATDADTNADIESAAVYVTAGTTNGKLSFNCTNTGGITMGTTAITFVAFTGASTATAGGGLTATGNVFAVGAGTGITVNADNVAVDTAVVARKYQAQIGNGALTTIVVNHALGNQWVNCQVFLNSGTFEEQECDIQLTDANNVTLLFTTAPASNALRVVITG